MDVLCRFSTLTPAEWTAWISAAVFYALRRLPPGFDSISVAAAIGLACVVIIAGIVGGRRRIAGVIAAVILCAVFSGAVASSRVRAYEVPPYFGLESVQSGDSALAVELSLRTEDDARRAANGEFQVWARIDWICSGDICASANARAFVRDGELPPLLAGTRFRAYGSLQNAGDVVFVRIVDDEVTVPRRENAASLPGVSRAARTAVTGEFRNRISGWPTKPRGVFAALFAGDRTDLPHSIERRMREAGAAHILALSGMHLGILAGSIYFISKRLMSPPAARVTACVFALVYLGFAGLRPSLVRAVVMLCIGTVIRAREGSVNIRVVLALSFIVHSALLPKDLTSLAFGLSFLSLLGLVFLAGGIHALLPSWMPRLLRGGIAAGLAAQTSTAPLVYSVFGVMHPAGIIVSILLTPVAVLIIALGGAALLSGAFSGPWLGALAPVVALLEEIARIGGRLPSLASPLSVTAFMLVIPVLLVVARLRYRWQLRRWRRYAHEQRLFRFHG